MSLTLDTNLKADDKTRPDVVMEFVRTKDGFLFDEVSVLAINHVPAGLEFIFEYERHGRRVRDLSPVIMSREEFAAARSQCKAKADIAKTKVPHFLFNSGARQWNERNTIAQADMIADMDFIDMLGARDGQ